MFPKRRHRLTKQLQKQLLHHSLHLPFRNCQIEIKKKRKLSLNIYCTFIKQRVYYQKNTFRSKLLLFFFRKDLIWIPLLVILFSMTLTILIYVICIRVRKPYTICSQQEQTPEETSFPLDDNAITMV